MEYLMVSRDGGYSSAALSGQNTRTYHGLLVYPNHDFSDRIVTLSKFEETVHFQDQRFELSTNQFNEVIHPTGYQMIEKLELESQPAQLTLNYRWGDDFFFQKVQKQIEGKNELEFNYHNQSKEPLTLTLRPLTAFRSYHHSQAPQQNIKSIYSKSKKQIEIKSDLYSFFVQISSEHPLQYHDEAMVYRDMVYTEEQGRGLGHRESLNSPCAFTFKLEPKEKIKVSVKVIDKNKSAVTKNLFKLTEAESKIIAKFPSVFSVVTHAQDFVVRHNQSLKLLAGYHWFTNWGRDTLIAMRGLVLTTGRFSEAKELLENLLGSVHQGLIYNVYVEGNGAGSGYQYHSADASLLLFVALYDYVLGTNDLDFFSKHQKTLKSILDFFIDGTQNDIYFSDQKLLHAGNDSTALSWMDAKVEGRPVTSRSPYAIDLNALFYNALCTYDEFCRQTKFPTAYEKTTQELFLSFKKYFWNGQFGNDFLDEKYQANSQLRKHSPTLLLFSDKKQITRFMRIMSPISFSKITNLIRLNQKSGSLPKSLPCFQ
jgi:predicted glycogen debranching enzyme